MNYPQLNIVTDILIYNKIKISNYDLKSDSSFKISLAPCMLAYFAWFFFRLPIHLLFQLKHIFNIIRVSKSFDLDQALQNVQKHFIPQLVL